MIDFCYQASFFDVTTMLINFNKRFSNTSTLIEGSNPHKTNISINIHSIAVDAFACFILFFSLEILVFHRVFSPLSLFEVIYRPFILYKITLDCRCIVFDLLFDIII